MKQYLIIAIAIPLIAMSFAFDQVSLNSGTQDVTRPEEVQTILNKSCMPCHSDQGSGLKSKSKLNFDKLNDLDPTKKVSKLLKIAEEIEEKKMPKSGYIKKHPEAALTTDEADLLIKWAEKEAEQIVGKK